MRRPLSQAREGMILLNVLVIVAIAPNATNTSRIPAVARMKAWLAVIVPPSSRTTRVRVTSLPSERPLEVVVTSAGRSQNKTAVTDTTIVATCAPLKVGNVLARLKMRTT